MKKPIEITIASGNKGKIAEISAALTDCNVTLRSVLEIDPQFDPPETGKTLEENAEIKARAVVKLTGGYALADDTGLFVDALGGAPGIHAARYAGEHCSFADNTAKMLQALTGVPLEKRTAKFIAVLALAHPEQPTRYFQGECAGVITTAAVGDKGFGYDPIFFVPELGKTFAQADLKTKEKFSHRGRALAKLAEWLAGGGEPREKMEDGKWKTEKS